MWWVVMRARLAGCAPHFPCCLLHDVGRLALNSTLQEAAHHAAHGLGASLGVLSWPVEAGRVEWVGQLNSKTTRPMRMRHLRQGARLSACRPTDRRFSVTCGDDGAGLLLQQHLAGG